MNSIVRSVQAFGLDLSVFIRFGNGQASAAVAFEGQTPQGRIFHAQSSCDDSAVHDVMNEVHQFTERAYQEYRAARLCRWAAQLVSPIGTDFQLSVFDQWLLEKLVARCPQFQLGWTPLQDYPASFRLMRDAGSLWIQVLPSSHGGSSYTGVVEVSDAHSVINAVRGVLGQLGADSVITEAAD